MKNCPAEVKNIGYDLGNLTGIRSRLEASLEPKFDTGVFSIQGREAQFEASLAGSLDGLNKLSELMNKYEDMDGRSYLRKVKGKGQ